MARRVRSRRPHRDRHPSQAHRSRYRRQDDDLGLAFSLPRRRHLRQGRQCLRVHPRDSSLSLDQGDRTMTKRTLFRGLAFAVSFGLASALLSLPAHAVDNMSTSSDAPDLTSVRTKIKAGDYTAALTELRELVEDTQHADVYNLLGFTLRKTGDVKTSLTYYTKALELQPDHKAAHEYLGELYVETGNMEK